MIYLKQIICCLTLILLASCNSLSFDEQEYYEYRVYKIDSSDKQQQVMKYLRMAYVPAMHRMRLTRIGVFVNAKKLDDYDSPVVAVIGAGLAWDLSLRGLLPDQVSGIFAVVSNSCNQSYTYLLDGPDALYIGEGNLYEPEYESDGVTFDLSQGQNPDFSTTPGHCLYRMVSIAGSPSSSIIVDVDSHFL